MATEELNKGNITSTVLRKNWALLKEIIVDDIIDKMIEQDLISIEKSIEYKQQKTRGQQTETLLYDVYRKPQSYLDAFITILDGNGYDFIVQKLLKKDSDTEKSNSQQLNPSSDEFCGSNKMRSNVEHQKLSEAVAPETDNAIGGIENKEVRSSGNETHQSKMEENIQKLTQIAEQQTRTMQEQKHAIENLTQQVDCLQKQSTAQTKQQSEQSEKQKQAIMAKVEKEFRSNASNWRQNEISKKEYEEKIKKLTSKLKSLQDKIKQEHERANNELQTKSDKIKDLEREKTKLQKELTMAKLGYSNSLKRQEEFILKTFTDNHDTLDNRNLNKTQKKENTKKDKGETQSSCPKPQNLFLAPVVKPKARGKGAPEKKN